MTREEAIKVLKVAVAEVEWEYPMDYAAAFDLAIEALEQEPCDDLISREAALDALCENCIMYDICYKDDSQRCENFVRVRGLPPVQSAQTPCDLCMYDPPSSGDGKPCSMCPATAKDGEGK